MTNKFQNLNWATPVIEKHFSKNPKASVSAMFRRLRKQERFGLIGDYPLMVHVVNMLKRMGLKPKRSRVAYACKQSKELQGKKVLISALLGC